MTSSAEKIIKKYKPEALSIETLFLTTNQKTVMHVAEARGVVIYECSNAGLKIFEASLIINFRQTILKLNCQWTSIINDKKRTY